MQNGVWTISEGWNRSFRKSKWGEEINKNGQMVLGKKIVALRHRFSLKIVWFFYWINLFGTEEKAKKKIHSELKKQKSNFFFSFGVDFKILERNLNRNHICLIFVFRNIKEKNITQKLMKINKIQSKNGKEW